MNRVVLAHAHIFKNAGTTIDWILERNFGRDFRDDREDQLMLKDPSYLASLIQSSPSMAAVSSHSLPLPAAPIDGVNLQVLAMLRHPLLRVRSVYDFERKQKAQTPGAIHAKKYSFKEYVEWRLQATVSPTIRNMQVLYLSRNVLPAGQSLSDAHLQGAINFVKRQPLIGLVDRFDESMVVFSEHLLNMGFELDFSYVRKNVTSTVTLSELEKLDRLKADLGVSLYDLLVSNNELDLQLLDVADRTVRQRFDLINNAQQKMSEIRRQSALLKAS